MVISKTIDHIPIKIMKPNPSQVPPASSKATDEDLKNMDVLCTFKFKEERDQIRNKSDNVQIKINQPNPI